MSNMPPTTSLPRSASTRHQQPPLAGYSDRDRPMRSQSTNTRSVAPGSPRRSLSSSQTASAHNRTPSNNLQHVAHHDYEQGNLARPPSGTRRSDSHDRPVNGAGPTRGESQRSTAAHGRTYSRQASDQPTPSSNVNGNGADPRMTAAPQALRRRTTVDAQTGHWDLGKTIGAGSMGKVKLARNKETGEQVAVKIVPRQSTEGEHRTQAERDRAEHSKEIRTAREAAIVTLVDHPYICGMRDVVRTNYHWYMLFEYVNGGQMLDYIISHGRLKEKQARKFGRQIASALDYCHRNSIVHRDLKIENILISKNGDIKIIDFGLSNLFSPRSHLKTFCGSLYFAAPELLQAKQYTGPEVDIWSFGIVLYVLVCGKVPFDDQSMPQLHAKIKRGNVEYPPWLSPECRGLIARMLNTNPQERATLHEIMNHPWMVKGFNGPPENYLPIRKPIQLPLDPAVIEKMTGFNFGPAEVISSDLTKIVESEEYQRAIRAAERRNIQQTPEHERKRGVFDFYKRRNSTTSKDTLNTPSSEALQLGQDPTNAFAPLISVYYLVMEKQEREAKEKNPGAVVMPQTTGDNISGLPELTAPEAAYTNSQTYEMAGEKPTGGRTRPRARTHGEDDVASGLQNLNVATAPSPVNPTIVEPPNDQQEGSGTTAAGGVRKENAATSLLRRLSTRRHRDPAERPERQSLPPMATSAYSPQTPAQKNFNVRRTREGDANAGAVRPDSAQTADGAAYLTPAAAADSRSDHSKRSHGLGRSISVNSSDMRRRFSRRGVPGGLSKAPGSQDGSRESSIQEGTANQHDAHQQGATSDAESTTRPWSGNLASRTRSVGHSRKGSIQTRRALQADGMRASDVPEETDQEMQNELEGTKTGGSNNSGFKPVFLKGVFSVSTTSSKPVSFIRSDIIRVLKQLGVDFSEIKGGFRCRHTPSIIPGPDDTTTSSTTPADVLQKRRISLNAFGGRNSTVDRERGHNSSGARNRQGDFVSEDETDEDGIVEDRVARYRLPSNSAGVAGETSTHVQADLGSNLTLKFEVLVVKVPLLGLHGIQFKKVDGGTWQYKNMAQTILKELRL